MNIMAVGAHPDDIELMAVGTLTKMRENGHQVIMCYLTNGDMGHAKISPDTLADIRKSEAYAATQVVGAEFEWLAMPDEFLFSEDQQTRMALVNLMRKHQVDTVISHTPDDYHPDHRAASKLVFDATFLASIPHIGSVYPQTPSVPVCYHMDTLGGVNFQPTRYVDITSVWETKLTALRKHESQLTWMKDHDGVDLTDYVRVMSEFRGLQSGVRYAEGFRLAERWSGIRATASLL